MNENSREIKFFIKQKQNHDGVIENIKVLINILILIEQIKIED